MGEYADMMLEGELCHGCGVALHGKPTGEPTFCRSCQKEANIARNQAEGAAAKKAPCPTCGKRVRLVGMADHHRDVHSGAAQPSTVKRALPAERPISVQGCVSGITLDRMKALRAKALHQLDFGSHGRHVQIDASELLELLTIADAVPALLAALRDLATYDGYDTEYDGRMLQICPSCGKQDGEHASTCQFVAARAVIAKLTGSAS
ncbi:hypothetical protein GT347_20120 [Xylophilus rhododendri]|uniref:C2H2-type domain-containing protein n=1 Tax=Xylophilus rhododendri TaxID=2697032 RepID=A0A857JAB7_9BURK|nr:hypothetical protein [Xylophilus rhododendri]QHJ00082.1 hypothetical protein GT347_20120 [Xylophilus rhododendri]